MSRQNPKIGKGTWAVVAATVVLFVAGIAMLAAAFGGDDKSSAKKTTRNSHPRAYEIARRDCYKAAASLDDPRHAEAMNDELAFALQYADTHTFGPRGVVSEGCADGLSEGKAHAGQ